MKQALNMIAPIVVAVYLLAFIWDHPSAGLYVKVTEGLVLVGCILWFSWGLADGQ